MLSDLFSLDRPVAIAHRGGARLRPENTLAAFEHAAALEVDAIECDVHLARDREPVVIHDATLERTTNLDGPVAARTSGELARADAGYRFAVDGHFPHRGRGIGVPRLVEALARVPHVPFVVEIKGDEPAAVAPVLAAIERGGAAGRVAVGAFSQRVLDEVRRTAPDLPTSASSAEVRTALRRVRLFLRPRAGAFAVFQMPLHLNGRTVFDRRFVRAARRAGLPVQVWIVNEADEMRRLLGWGVTGLISDRPDVAIAEIGAWRGRSPR